MGCIPPKFSRHAPSIDNLCDTHPLCWIHRIHQGWASSRLSARSFVRPFVLSLARSFVRSLVRSFVCSFKCSFAHEFGRSLGCSFFERSKVHPCMYVLEFECSNRWPVSTVAYCPARAGCLLLYFACGCLFVRAFCVCFVCVFCVFFVCMCVVQSLHSVERRTLCSEGEPISEAQQQQQSCSHAKCQGATSTLLRVVVCNVCRCLPTPTPR